MEEKKPISHFVAGLIIAAILIIYSTLLNYMGLFQNQSLGWVSYFIFIGGLILFTNLYGKAKNNQVTFGNPSGRTQLSNFALYFQLLLHLR